MVVSTAIPIPSHPLSMLLCLHVHHACPALPTLQNHAGNPKFTQARRGSSSSKPAKARASKKHSTAVVDGTSGDSSSDADVPRPMSIKERIERDKQREAAERRALAAVAGAAGVAARGSTGDDVGDDGDDASSSHGVAGGGRPATVPSSESSYAPSAATFDSLEPMERAEIAAAVLVSWQ